MSKRVPMDPPQLAGFRFERLLGSGGYSDVFLYQQEMPRRPVAIKVLLTDRLDQRALGQVGDEANAMAAVSTHPYIVTIFHAELTGAANPFLVMEFYPRPNYSVRARTEQLSVAEVLRTGIQVASAVETAHRVEGEPCDGHKVEHRVAALFIARRGYEPGRLVEREVAVVPFHHRNAVHRDLVSRRVSARSKRVLDLAVYSHTAGKDHLLSHTPGGYTRVRDDFLEALFGHVERVRHSAPSRKRWWSVKRHFV